MMEHTPEMELYREYDCPYCRTMETNIVIPINRKGFAKQDVIYVEIGGTKGHDRWRSICQRIGGNVTPILRVINKIDWKDDYIFFFRRGRSTEEEVERVYKCLMILLKNGEEEFRDKIRSGELERAIGNGGVGNGQI